jgi:hypothetical protein
MQRIAFLAALVASAMLLQTTAQAGVPAERAEPPARQCVPRDTVDLTPTSRAPDWYVPGVTPPCIGGPGKGARGNTAYWIGYECYWYQTCWRTTPLNADYSANDCEASYTTCGEKIIYDPGWFYWTCVGLGLSKYEVARNIRYWADRARANGANWRVYTFTESGGNPYGCRFSIVAL